MRRKNQGDWEDHRNPEDNPSNLSEDKKTIDYYADGNPLDEDYAWQRPEGRSNTESVERYNKSRSSEELYQRAFEKKQNFTEDRFFDRTSSRRRSIVIRVLFTLVLLAIIAALVFAIFKQLERREDILSTAAHSSSQSAEDPNASKASQNTVESKPNDSLSEITSASQSGEQNSSQSSSSNSSTTDTTSNTETTHSSIIISPSWVNRVETTTVTEVNTEASSVIE